MQLDGVMTGGEPQTAEHQVDIFEDSRGTVNIGLPSVRIRNCQAEEFAAGNSDLAGYAGGDEAALVLVDLYIFQRLRREPVCFGPVCGQRLGDDRKIIKVVHAPDRESEHDGIDFFADRVRVQKEVLTAGVELLVIRKDVIDLVTCDCIRIVYKVGGNLDVFGAELIDVKTTISPSSEFMGHEDEWL